MRIRARKNHFTKVNNMTLPEVLERLKAAGLGSLPGGGAEILVDHVRSDITRELPGRHEVPFEVVRTGTTGASDFVEPAGSAQGETPAEPEGQVAESGSSDLFGRQKDIDYLDIPAFLRTQAD